MGQSSTPPGRLRNVWGRETLRTPVIWYELNKESTVMKHLVFTVRHKSASVSCEEIAFIQLMRSKGVFAELLMQNGLVIMNGRY